MTDATLRIFDPVEGLDVLFRLFDVDIEFGPFQELTYTFSGQTGTGEPAQFVLFGSGDVDNRDRPLPEATFDRFLVAIDGATASVLEDFTASGDEVAPIVSAFLGTDISARATTFLEFLETRSLTVIGSDEGDVFDGTDNDDVLRGLGGADSLDGEEGDDRILGNAGRDTLDGDLGNDRMAGGRGSDVLDGGEGDDRLAGGRGNDVILGGEGDDEMEGNGGDDIIDGGDGQDDLFGRDGDDSLIGGGGDDGILGGRGDDVILGGAGNDLLFASAGDDTVLGGKGNDTIKVDEGNNIVVGGRGNDIFLVDFLDVETGLSVVDIRDFDRRGDDVVRLAGGPISFEELTIEARGNGSVVTYAPDPTIEIVLRRVAPDSLTEDDFIF